MKENKTFGKMKDKHINTIWKNRKKMGRGKKKPQNKTKW